MYIYIYIEILNRICEILVGFSFIPTPPFLGSFGGKEIWLGVPSIWPRAKQIIKTELHHVIWESLFVYNMQIYIDRLWTTLLIPISACYYLELHNTITIQQKSTILPR